MNSTQLDLLSYRPDPTDSAGIAPQPAPRRINRAAARHHELKAAMYLKFMARILDGDGPPEYKRHETARLSQLRAAELAKLATVLNG